MFKVINWLLLIVYMSVIFFLSSQSQLPSVVTIFNDKLLHTLEFTFLGVLFVRALQVSFPRLSFKQLLVYTILFCFIYGLSDEFHQSFVPGREVSLYDALADGIGGFLGVIGWRLLCLIR
jgi:VanZ family protein